MTEINPTLRSTNVDTDTEQPNIEGEIWCLVGLTQILQRETAIAVACCGGGGAFGDASNCLALSVLNVSDRVNELDLSGYYLGPALVAASQLMHEQLGIVLNSPKDIEALEALQKVVHITAKLAADLDKEYQEYGVTYETQLVA